MFMLSPVAISSGKSILCFSTLPGLDSTFIGSTLSAKSYGYISFISPDTVVLSDKLLTIFVMYHLPFSLSSFALRFIATFLQSSEMLPLNLIPSLPFTVITILSISLKPLVPQSNFIFEVPG